MFKPNRRECLQGVLATMAAGAAPAISRALPRPQADKTASSDSDKIKVCLVWSAKYPYMVKLAKQIGVTHMIAGAGLRRVPRDQYVNTVAKVKAEYDAAGLTIAGFEGHPVAVEKIHLGLPGRDEQLENYVAAIKALGEVGIPMLCYD